MDAHLTQHPASTTIVVQPSLPTYVERLAACHQAAYGYAEPGVEDLTAEKFAQHLAVFPAGQFMALEVETDQIVGLTASMRIDFDPQKPTMRSWGAATHFGWLTTHNPHGQWLYGVDSAVLAAYRSRGVGGKLIEARFDLVRDLNLLGMVAGSLIIDYHKVARDVSAEEYVRDVVAGTRFDSNLSKQLKKGFEAHGLIPQYSDYDDAGGWGVELVWRNPAYQPQRRVFAVGQRPVYTLAPRLNV